MQWALPAQVRVLPSALRDTIFFGLFGARGGGTGTAGYRDARQAVVYRWLLLFVVVVVVGAAALRGVCAPRRARRPARPPGMPWFFIASLHLLQMPMETVRRAFSNHLPRPLGRMPSEWTLHPRNEAERVHFPSPFYADAHHLDEDMWARRRQQRGELSVDVWAEERAGTLRNERSVVKATPFRPAEYRDKCELWRARDARRQRRGGELGEEGEGE